MKKIINTPKNFRLKGVVESDGVGFSPVRNIETGYIMTPGYFASADENGNIKTQYMSEKYEEVLVEDCSKMDQKINYLSKTTLWLSAGIAAVFFVLSAISITWPNGEIWQNVFLNLFYIMLAVICMRKSFTIFGANILGDTEMQSFSQYLGAKNAVENAYYALGRAPDLDEVKDYSIYSSESKYTKLAYFASLLVIICAVRFFNGWWYWVTAVLAVVILCILDWKTHLCFWQTLSINKPDEDHYRVAIRALEECAEGIDFVKMNVTGFVFKMSDDVFDEQKCNGCPEYDFCKEASLKNCDNQNNEAAKLDERENVAAEEPSDSEEKAVENKLTADESANSDNGEV